MADRRDMQHLIPISMILPGIGLALLGTRFDGFVQGLCQGAGVALILLGVYALGLLVRQRRDDERDPGGPSMWLPSRDEDGR